MSGNRSRSARTLVIIGALIAAAVLGIAWSQNLVVVSLAGSDTSSDTLALGGPQVVPAVGACALTSIVALFVAAFARLTGRIIALSAGVILSAGAAWGLIWLIVSTPEALRVSIAHVSGIADVSAQAAIIRDVTLTAWLVTGLVAGLTLTAVFVVALVTARQWTSSQRFQRQSDSSPHSANNTTADTSETWDTLSQGIDPTGR